MPQAPRNTPAALPAIVPPLLKWYDRHRRVLPWRALPGQTPNPYAVWLSEIMLQQTTVPVVGPYYHKFLATWPTVHKLAAASQNDVLAAWAGLGYYSRARNLHACAKAVVERYKGVFPSSEAELLTLPGIGPYTAAAITAIAFDKPANVVDGNVERVMSRLFTVAEPLPNSKPALKALAAQLVPAKRAGDYAQALMDLGATICTPRSPNCPACPLQKMCAAYAEGNPAQYPKRVRKKAKPVRRALVLALHDGKGRLWMRQRPDKGLLASMIEFPSSPWQEEAASLPETLRAESKALGKALPAPARWQMLESRVKHVFTHFELQLEIACAKATQPPAGMWLTPQEARKMALPSLMNKILKLVEAEI